MRTLDPAAAAGRLVLLLAPHPDDEALGAGGTAALMARAGARVLPVIMARGDGGIGGDGADADVRRAESEQACKALGVQPPRFAGLTSSSLRADPAAAARRLAELLAGERADVLLVPSPFERHHTHRAVLLAALLADVAAQDARWWGWGVWDAVPAVDDAAEVDVGAARAAKTSAVSAHRSQDGSRALVAGIAARDMAQAVFSRITGAEDRKAVERLLDVTDLAGRAAAVDGRAVEAVRALVAEWTAERCAQWARALWVAS